MNGELKLLMELRDMHRDLRNDAIANALEVAVTALSPTPAPGALPELDLLIRDMEMYAGDELEGSRLERLSAHWSKRLSAYAEQRRAGVVVTDAMVERSARKVCEIAMQDWDDIGPFAQSVLMDTQRAALQSAFADDEGVKRG